MESMKCVKTLKGHERDVVSIFLINYLNTLVSASFDKKIKIWDLNKGKIIQLGKIIKLKVISSVGDLDPAEVVTQNIFRVATEDGSS